ncbi:chemotaxis protein CheW [Parasphingopyxis marina]|uniref:Chemotaxis protein CheW n=1 Tax=Parasphingopyxis marina TaxID=2761622 RepID=A0A842HX29_9SPHN|nr:chemotaxis protein CheW [Parasphingopyxis marina]MBC2777666.1 chemotaxis protein CheW [Parasphingopyxis marina]
MEKLYLLAEADGSTFAISADAIESVVTAGEIVPVPLAASWVAGLTALRSRVITVVDTIASIYQREAEIRDGQSLVVVNVDGNLYGLAVDEVHDVCEYSIELERLGASFDSGWRRVSSGMIEADGAAVIVVDPAILVLPETAIAA